MKAKKGSVFRNISGDYIHMPTDETVTEFNGGLLTSKVDAFVLGKLANPLPRQNLLEKLKKMMCSRLKSDNRKILLKECSSRNSGAPAPAEKGTGLRTGLMP